MPTKKIILTRLEDGTVEARNENGASLILGHMRGVFDPGEVAQIALAGCAILSSNKETMGKEVRAEVSGEYNREDNRFESFTETIFVKGEEESEEIKQAVLGAIRKNCTIARTYERGAGIQINIEIEQK